LLLAVRSMEYKFDKSRLAATRANPCRNEAK
jgi:hypothetical protein